MKRTVVNGMVIGILASVLAISAASLFAQSGTYTWRNVQIVGGGFVPSIIYNQTQPDLVYARTDIGGAYRRDPATQRWVPLLDWIGWTDWNWIGVASLATDPIEPNRLYLAVGTYTNEWTSQNGAILRSLDQGASWQRTDLPFKLGGNMPGRGMGERLAIDPNKNSILYLAAPSGNGVWKSTDYGVSWARVTSFPNPGNYVQDPSNSYTADNQGDVWVTFDKRTGTAGNPTQTIYVGVADLGTSVYRSTNGGVTWTALAGQPTGFLPHKGVLDTVNGYLFIAYSDKGGPYDGGHGDVWRYATATGAWTLVSPIPSTDTSNNFFGYSGLTVDRQHPGTVMVTGYSSWWPDTQIWRSNDSGATWTRIWDWTRYPNRSFRYTQDVSIAPWLKFPPAPVCGGGRPGAEVNPKLGWMTEGLEIDPFNSNKMMYGTGATIYGTDNLTNWDSGGQITITVKAAGLEETAVLDLVSPPSGAPLLSALGDIGGFRHDVLTTVPSTMWSPIVGTNTSLDFAELSPAYIVRAGNGNTANCEKSAAISTNGGTSWTAVSSQPSGLTGGGTIAVSASGAGKIVWSPQGIGVYRTTNAGKQWAASTGIPAGARVASDRVNANKFYGFLNGVFYVSTDGGATFATAASSGLPLSASKFKAVAGHEGDIWLAGGATGGEYGLYHSTNSGASFTRLGNVQEADAVGFGKAATGQTYPAIFISAKIADVRGLYRSDDAGATWNRVNDDQHQYGVTNTAITGDPRIYGRIYLGANGRGIVYGDPAP